MKTTEKRCPAGLAIDLVGGKWKPLILWRLSAGTLRFAQLQRAMPEVTQRMLTLQLRELERDGLVRRDVFAEVPPRVEYSLTDAVDELLPILQALGEWALRHHGRPQAADAAQPESVSAASPAGAMRQ